jgi:hypothetical protein
VTIRSAARSLAEEPFDEHAVFPLAVEASVTALDADFFKAGGPVRSAAGMVVSEDTAGELVEALAFGLGAEAIKQLPAEALSAGGGVHVDGVFADPLVHAAV